MTAARALGAADARRWCAIAIRRAVDDDTSGLDEPGFFADWVSPGDAIGDIVDPLTLATESLVAAGLAPPGFAENEGGKRLEPFRLLRIAVVEEWAAGWLQEIRAMIMAARASG